MTETNMTPRTERPGSPASRTLQTIFSLLMALLLIAGFTGMPFASAWAADAAESKSTSSSKSDNDAAPRNESDSTSGSGTTSSSAKPDSSDGGSAGATEDEGSGNGEKSGSTATKGSATSTKDGAKAGSSENESKAATEKAMVTITSNEANQGVTYKAIKIFSGTVTKSDNGTTRLGGIQWASENIKNAVEARLRNYKTNSAYPTAENNPKAQQAAEFISKNIGKSKGSAYVLDNSELGNQIAVTLKDMPGTYTGIKPGTPTEFESGYYLILTETASIDDANAKEHRNLQGTAPIFVTVGTDNVTIKEKVDKIPTHTKQVMSDAAYSDPETPPSIDDKGWGSVADAQVGQWVWYQQVASLPSTYATYGTYRLEFHDKLSKGLSGDEGSMKVWAVNGLGDSCTKTQLAQDSYRNKYDGHTNTWTVSIEDLKNVKASSSEAKSNITKDTRIVLQYRASLKTTSETTYGNPGNENSAYLGYSNNPNTGSVGMTKEVSTHVFTYQVKLLKKDLSTQENLKDAGFTLQATGADDAASKDQYVQKDGSLGPEPYKFLTDDDGTLTFYGLDAGAYKLRETHPPAGYNAVPDTTFQIKPTYHADQNQQNLDKVALEITDGGSDALAGTLVKVNDTDKTDKISSGDAAGSASGDLSLTVTDIKTVDMPFTGQQGISLLIGAGLAIVGISLVLLMRRRQTLY